jgi:uncharacterized protein with LGFP repeats
VIRTLIRLVTVVAVVATALLVPASVETPGSTAQAADMRLFDAGNIISDAVFFDSLSMDAGAVQRFLDAKGASCVAAEMPCLKDYRQDTADQAVDPMCAGYRGARAETAAAIITKVAASCGISPRVLLVLLQKEQSLVTRKTPTVYAYTHATGFACPDTAPCNPAFSGFVSQVYFAARQFQRYKIESSRYGYKAGRVNTIQYHPNIACGTSQVFIANQATAGLYNYTPYRPTDAALYSGPAGVPSSSPDAACAAYGNRNFWTYFTDWFGSTQSSGGGAIYTKYQELGGAAGRLGQVVSPFYCGLANGGCYQVFASGSIYWSPASGAWSVAGAVLAKWGQVGVEWGTVGYPVSDTWCGLAGGGCFGHFERGSIYWSPSTGGTVVRGDFKAKWSSIGWEGSSLGYPVMDDHCGLVNGGCYQVFQGGALYWSAATGTHVVSGALRDRWGTVGNEWGTLGYPVNDSYCGLVANGCFQHFQGGSLYHSPASGTQMIRGQMRDRWAASGWEVGALGYPTSDEYCGLIENGCFQRFQKGSLYRTPGTGTRIVLTEVRDAWGALGWEGGALGYPVNDTFCGLARGGCYQVFQRGSLYWTASTGGHLVRGAIREAWAATGWEVGTLGYPTTDEYCGLVNGGCFEHFEKGSIYFTPATGAHSVSGPIKDAWVAQGYETGSWGYPKGEPRTTADGVVQAFTGGTATYSTATNSVTFQ